MEIPPRDSPPNETNIQPIEMLLPVRTVSTTYWRYLTLSKTAPSLGRTILSLRNDPKRFYAAPSATSADAPVDLEQTRNIGIIAHIDAVCIPPLSIIVIVG